MVNPRTLVLLVTSGVPDPYVNVICHCVASDLASSILFVVVDEPEGPSARATEVQAGVMTRISQLADSPDSSAQRLYAAVSDKINGAGVRAKVIKYAQLFEHLATWAREGNIIDVTALDKRLSIEVAAILMSLHYRDAFSFRFLRSPTHSDRDLFHALKPHADFEYVRIVDTPPMQKALARAKRWTIDARLFAFFCLVSIIITAILSYGSGAAAFGLINNLASVFGILTAGAVLIRGSAR